MLVFRLSVAPSLVIAGGWSAVRCWRHGLVILNHLEDGGGGAGLRREDESGCGRLWVRCRVNILLEVEGCDFNAAPTTDWTISQPAPAPKHTFSQNNDKPQADIIVCHLA